MSLRFIDSFSHYLLGASSTVMSRKWTQPIRFGSIQASGGDRNSGYASLDDDQMTKTLTPTANWFMGCRMFFTSGSSGGGFGIGNGGLEIAQIQVNSDYTISLFAGGNRIATTVQAIQQNAWQFVECSFALTGGTGTITVSSTLQVNGDVWLNTSGASSQVGSGFLFPGNFANEVFVGNGNSVFSVQDFYAYDNVSTDINGFATTCTTFVGDVGITALFPDADIGTASSWSLGGTGGTGTHAYTFINETNPDDDGSYLYTTNTGSNEAFNYQPISSFTGTIFGAQYLACVKKDAEGLRTVAVTLNNGTLATSNFATTTGSNTSTVNYLNDYYVYYIAPLDSALGTAWTPTVFNTASFGITVST